MLCLPRPLRSGRCRTVSPLDRPRGPNRPGLRHAAVLQAGNDRAGRPRVYRWFGPAKRDREPTRCHGVALQTTDLRVTNLCASRKQDLRTRGLMAARRCSFDCLGASPSAHSKGLPPKTTDEISEAGNFVAFRVPENPLSVCTPRSRRRAGSSALLPERKAPDQERNHSRH